MGRRKGYSNNEFRYLSTNAFSNVQFKTLRNGNARYSWHRGNESAVKWRWSKDQGTDSSSSINSPPVQDGLSYHNDLNSFIEREGNRRRPPPSRDGIRTQLRKERRPSSPKMQCSKPSSSLSHSKPSSSSSHSKSSLALRLSKRSSSSSHSKPSSSLSLPMPSSFSSHSKPSSSSSRSKPSLLNFSSRSARNQSRRTAQWDLTSIEVSQKEQNRERKTGSSSERQYQNRKESPALRPSTKPSTNATHGRSSSRRVDADSSTKQGHSRKKTRKRSKEKESGPGRKHAKQNCQKSSTNSRKRALLPSTNADLPKRKSRKISPFFRDDHLARICSKDPSEIIVELLKDRKAFTEFLKSDDVQSERVEDILEVLSKLYQTPHTQNFTELLALFQGTAFVTKHIRSYILQRFLALPTQKEEQRNQWACVKRITTFFQEFLKRFPNSYEELPLDVLATRMPRLQVKSCDNNDGDNNNNSDGKNKSCNSASASFNNASTQDEIMDDINKLLSHRDDIIRRQGTSAAPLSGSRPPDDFRNIPVFPRREDIFPDKPPFLRKNIKKGRYNNVNHYLDVQFRLLREDYIAPIREGIQEAISLAEDRSRSIHVYRNVRVVGRMLDSKSGGCLYRLLFNTAHMRLVNWEHSKRFKFGSLYCLIDAQTQSTMHFVTIAERVVEDLRKGLVNVKFFADDHADTVTHEQIFFMVESPAYFESYRYVLEGLQSLDETKLPFQRYLVECNSDVRPPGYLQNAQADDVNANSEPKVRLGCYNLNTALGCKDINLALSVSVLDENSWPSSSNVDLNISQLNAVKAALRQEFVVIQGPPGTGKTFVGLRITQALLDNKKNWYRDQPKRKNQSRRYAIPDDLSTRPTPLLVVCYTNHALDQFLEGILNFTQNIVRVGGRSKNQSLDGYNLRDRRKVSSQSPLWSSLKRDLKGFQCEIEKENLAIEDAVKNNLSEDQVLQFLNEEEVDQISQWRQSACQSRTSVFEAWLRMRDNFVPERISVFGDQARKRHCHESCNEMPEREKTTTAVNRKSEMVMNDPSQTGEEIRSKRARRRCVSPERYMVFGICQPRDEYDLVSSLKIENGGQNGDTDNFNSAADVLVEDQAMTNETKISVRPHELEILSEVEDGEVIDSDDNRSFKDDFVGQTIEEHEEKNTMEMVKRSADLTVTSQKSFFVDVVDQISADVNERVDFARKNISIGLEEGELLDSEDDMIVCDKLDDGATSDEEDERATREQTVDLPIALVPEAHSVSDQGQPNDRMRQIDLRSLSAFQRSNLYRAWVNRYIEFHRRELMHYRDLHDKTSERISEVESMQVEEILKRAEVIGMTTTGAAKHRSTLQEIKPRIVIVEEAAEVLEAHVVTALSSSTDHLILIGDHKQLKPNPEVYKLAREYNLEVSLFERMVTNGLTCHSLDTQHRMRPEIADVMRIIYPKLVDDESVRSYGRISGVQKNVYFIDHNVPESSNEELKSHCNDHEASFVAALCMYLLLQDYKSSRITVLTMYTGQLLKLRKVMPKSKYEGIRICSVDNFQGEESDIVVLSLVRSNKSGNIGFLNVANRVCVALSRAKMALYCIGNISMMAEQNNLWRKIKTHLEKESAISSSLPLCCPNHTKKIIQASTAEDFKNAPQGGCLSPCEFRLPCGHACSLLCHPKDPDHRQYRCKETCLEVLCDLNHRCKQLCHYGVGCGRCTRIIPKVIPSCNHELKIECWMSTQEIPCTFPCKNDLPCGHRCRLKCGEDCSKVPCREKLTRNLPCGHKQEVTCSTNIEKTQCKSPCGQRLECDHPCTGNCHACHQGTFHVQCTAPCKRTLVCSHECREPCTRNCPPCVRDCENRCFHSFCSKPCGALCLPCRMPCMWKCEHYRCNNRCGEMCDRKRCNKPCRFKLKCGHRCIGLCGEYCPKLCRVCHKDKLQTIFLGREDEPNALFVELVDCGHVFEVNDLDYWMEGMNNEKEQCEIQLKMCPKCNTPIRRSFRYGNIIKKTLADIEEVKKKVLVDQQRLRKKKARLSERVRGLIKRYPELPRDKMRLVELRAEVLRDVDECSTLKNQLKLLPCIGEIFRKFFQESDNAEFIKRYSKLRDEAKRLTEKLTCNRILSSQEVADISDNIVVLSLGCRFHYLLWQIESKFDQADLSEEIRSSLEALKKKLCDNSSPQTMSDIERTEAASVIEDVCRKLGIDALTPTELAAERKEIVKAIGLSKGHWFKCRNGHIYAIGECGGAMEKGMCPECNEEIGGDEHKLVEGNELAPEMDGANYAAWSDRANLENYDQEELRRLMMF